MSLSRGWVRLDRRSRMNALRCGMAGLLFLLGQAAAEQGGSAPSGAAPRLRSGIEMAPIFARQVKPRLNPPEAERRLYATLLGETLARADVVLTAAQYIVLVDRNPRVQAALVYWRDDRGAMHFIGASPVATGRLGEYEYFLSPLGVFEHTIENLDFRAEGTRNDLGIRGYGATGMRVFDFGWVMGERTWDGGLSPMRLQMHATDPDVLEPRLGSPGSKGCIRISSSLNQLLDRYGLLDADYDAALARGDHLWVLSKDRTPTPWSGRYLLVVESEWAQRPPWASLVSKGRKASAAAPFRAR